MEEEDEETSEEEEASTITSLPTTSKVMPQTWETPQTHASNVDK